MLLLQPLETDRLGETGWPHVYDVFTELFMVCLSIPCAAIVAYGFQLREAWADLRGGWQGWAICLHWAFSLSPQSKCSSNLRRSGTVAFHKDINDPIGLRAEQMPTAGEKLKKSGRCGSLMARLRERIGECWTQSHRCGMGVITMTSEAGRLNKGWWAKLPRSHEHQDMLLKAQSCSQVSTLGSHMVQTLENPARYKWQGQWKSREGHST